MRLFSLFDNPLGRLRGRAGGISGMLYLDPGLPRPREIGESGVLLEFCHA